MQNSKLEEIKKGHEGRGLLIEHDGYISLTEGSNIKLMEDFHRSEGTFCPYPFVVSAVFQKFGIQNANGRIYPEGVLKKQVEVYQEKIREKRAIGECNHPMESTIDLGRVSHNIIELHWEGHTLVGKLELNVSQGFVNHGICSTLGDTVANLLLNGYKIGVSSRGVGSVKQQMGKMIVGDDFEIICWDIVSDPSTPMAWIADTDEELAPYMESKSSTKDVISEKIDKIQQLL